MVSGTATDAVVKTDSTTEYGKIAKMPIGAVPETEFERGLKGFGFLIMQVAMFFVLFVFFINALLGKGVLDSFCFPWLLPWA